MENMQQKTIVRLKSLFLALEKERENCPTREVLWQCPYCGSFTTFDPDVYDTSENSNAATSWHQEEDRQHEPFCRSEDWLQRPKEEAAKASLLAAIEQHGLTAFAPPQYLQWLGYSDRSR